MSRAEKGSVLKQSHESSAEFLSNLRGCRVSAPIQGLWGGGCRIVEWIEDWVLIRPKVAAAGAPSASWRVDTMNHVAVHFERAA